MLSRSIRFKRPSSVAFVIRRFKTKFAYPAGMTAYEDDWSEQPQYPAIDPETHTWNEHRRERLQNILDRHLKIRNASCPEAKNLEINMPKQFGYKVLQLSEDYFDYHSLNAYKFVTRTHVASDSHLPSQYSSPELNEKVKYFIDKIKVPLMEALAFEMELSRSFEKEFNATPASIDLQKSQSIISQVNRVIISVLSQEVDYLKNCQVDLNPHVEAFWLIGGQEPTPSRRLRREGSLTSKSIRNKARYVKSDDPVENSIHYIGKSLLQIRCNDPLKNFVETSDALCLRSIEEIPDRFPHFLTAYGFRFPEHQYRYASIIPGHWSGDEHRSNLMAYHPRHYFLGERRSDKFWSAQHENEEAVLSQAVLAGFGRLLSQAFYHGFDQFGDLEYPFSTQTIISNGLEWSFFAYQLNTISLHQLAIDKNMKQNIIWGTKSQSIFKTEKRDELNEEVLENILKFYLNNPEKSSVENPTPYLGLRIQDWEDEQSRALTFFNFREQLAQRAYMTDNLWRFRPPEVYEYEKIYKILFNTMPMDPRRRHFELPKGFPGSDPWNEPYKMKDPLFESKGIRLLRSEVAKKKEEERIEAAKIAEGLKFGVVPISAANKKKK